MSDDEYRYPHSLKSLPVLPRGRGIGAAPETGSDLNAQAPSMEAASSSSAPADEMSRKLIEGKVIEALHEIYDPEIPVNIYELGLIYEIQVDPDRKVHIKMTLTAPACPVAGSLPGEVEKKVEAIAEVASADVELVWEPPWSRDRMSETALLTLGMM